MPSWLTAEKIFRGTNAVVKVYQGEDVVWPAIRPSELYITLTSDLTKTLYFSQSEENGVGIDWGDGSPIEYSSIVGNTSLTHTWASSGDKVVLFIPKNSVSWSPGGVDSDSNTCSIAGIYSKLLTDATITRFIFGSGIRTLNMFAFYGCTKLTEIYIPKGLTDLSSDAFGYCSNLSIVTFEQVNNMTRVQSGAFGNCMNLSSFVFGENISVIESNAFYNCSKMECSILPDSITQIGASAFGNCKAAIFSELPNELRRVGAYAFRSCISVTFSVFPSYLTSIGGYAFGDCTNVRFSELPDSIEYVGDYAFGGAGVTSFDWTSKITSIPSGCFNSCSNLSEIIFPNNLVSVGSSAFYGCTALLSVSFPDSLTHIDLYAFALCSGISELLIPSSVEYVRPYAFNSCANLQRVDIGAKSLAATIFSNCLSLSKIWIRDTVINMYSASVTVSSVSYYVGPFRGVSSTAILYCEASESQSGWCPTWNCYDHMPGHRLQVVYNQTTSPF